MMQPDLFLNNPVSIMNEYADLFTAEFRAWLPENLKIWEAFVSLSFKMIRAGRSHYAAKTIVEVLRFHSDLREASNTFKLNNNTTPYLSRLFHLSYPKHDGFFETRNAKRAIIDNFGEPSWNTAYPSM